MGFQLGFNIGFSMAFVSSFYLLFYVKERVCKSKHLQFVSGVNAVIFWFTSFVWDLITFFLTVIFIIITLVIFQEEGFRTVSQLGFVLKSNEIGQFVTIVFHRQTFLLVRLFCSGCASVNVSRSVFIRSTCVRIHEGRTL